MWLSWINTLQNMRKFKIAPLLDVLHNRYSSPKMFFKKKRWRKINVLDASSTCDFARVCVCVFQCVHFCVCIFPSSSTDLYILHLSLDESAECLKLGCNHADRCNRKIHSCYGNASWAHKAPPTCIRQYLENANETLGLPTEGKHSLMKVTLSSWQKK